MNTALRENLTLFEIATKDVVTIDINSSLYEAIALMNQNEIRDIIVTDNETDQFLILTISDILKQNTLSFSNIKIKDVTLKPCLRESKNFFVKDVIYKYNINFDYICLVEDEKLVGIVSKSDVIANFDPKLLASYERVVDLIKWHKINYVSYNTATKEAIPFLEDDLDDAVIINKNGKSVGIVTAKDVIKILYNNYPLEEPIYKYMSSPIEMLSENSTIQEAFDFLNEKHFKRVIISDSKEKIKGIITQTELTRLLHNKWLELTRTNFQKAVELEKLATHDPLTNAYNRTKFYKEIEKEESRIERNDISFYSLVMIDIDDFKFINDTYGHDMGDLVLKDIVSNIQKKLRKTDMLFRWGGEEFVILLPQTNIENAKIAAEKIRKVIPSIPFNMKKSITCSFGVSAKKSKKDNAELILKRADNALYKAKREGKNRVEAEE